MSDDILTTLRRTFAGEADEVLVRLEEGLLALSEGDCTAETINEIFRAAHTLKGGALAVELRQVGELAHVVEELFCRWRDGVVRPSQAQVSWAFGALEMLRTELQAGLQGNRSADARVAAATRDGDPHTVPVHIDRLDELLDLVGELVIARGREETLLSAPKPDLGQLLDANEVSASRLRDVQDRVMGLRLVPFGPTLRRLQRTVNETAHKLGKTVRFESNAHDVEIDVSLSDGIRDALMHMVRNSVDHGIEPPAARRAAGKPEFGTVRVDVERKGGFMLVRIRDDGRGLDRERLARKAREAGIDTTPETITTKIMADLIFQPGFSTAERVTDVSGRGVGMDVVRDGVTKLRGTISLETEAGRGTTFLIRVPLALAIMNGFRVGVGGQSFVMPADSVIECVDAGAASACDAGLVEIRGRSTPRLSLSSVFSLPHVASDRRSLVLVQHESGPVALEVDELFGAEQTVIKKLGPLFRSLESVAGAAVLGSGEVAIILDVFCLVDAAIAARSAA